MGVGENMKKSGLTMMAGLAALAIASTASAQTNLIHITGSNASKKSLSTAIGNILNAGYVYGYAGTSLGSASQFEFRGTTITGNFPVDITVNLIGGVGGVQDLVQNLAITTWFNATNLTTGGTANLAGPLVSAQADVAIAEQFQSSTGFNTPVLHDQVIGVVPYLWTRNAGSPNTITNVTSLLAQILYGTGQIPLSQITGLSSDETIALTALGRDENASVRLIAFAETGFGIFTPPLQYQVIISGSPGPGGSVTGITPWPSNTVNGTAYPIGHSGYAKGSDLAAALNTPGSFGTTGGWFIGPLALTDAQTVSLGATLNYNGVAYSPQAVEEGQYTFWSYTHLFYRSGYTGNPKTIADQIGNRILNFDAVQSGLLVTSLNVGRAVDGGEVTFGNPY
jgi:hypothetical protein